MSTTPVTIDMSTAQPIAQPVQLDMSTAKPIGQSQPTPPAAPPPGALDRIGSDLSGAVGQVGDLAAGAGKGVLSTANGVGSLIRGGLNMIHSGAGDTIIPPAGQQAAEQLAVPSNMTQKVGKTAEDIGEFFLGDEALKGVALGEKAMKAAGLAEKYEKASPFVKAAIEHTMNAVRQGGVAGAETTTKTGDVKQGVEAAAGAAAGSAVIGGASDLLGSGLKYIRAAKGLTELPGALDKAVADTVSKKAVADGLKATTGTTAAEHLGDSALQYEARAKQGYKVVDNAVNGELQPLQDKLRQTQKAIKMSLDPEVTDKLMSKQEDLQALYKDAIERAKANGVPDAEDIIKKADQDYNKFRAQSDLSTRLQKAAGPNGAASPAGLHVWSKQLGTPKIVGGTSRLEQALGPDGAEAVKSLAAQGRSKAEELASQAAVGKVVKEKALTGAATAAGVGGAGAVGYTAYRVLSGH